MLAPARLPDFDQAATDRRFLLEVDRLLSAGAFASYSELAATLGISPNYFAAIEAGRYHCNLKLLYGLARHYPETNLNFILFGPAKPGAEPAPAVPVRQRGRRWAGHQAH